MPKPPRPESSKMPSPAEALTDIRATVAQLRTALLTPDSAAVAACIPGLHGAIDVAQALVPAVSRRLVSTPVHGDTTKSNALQPELVALRRDLLRVAALIAHGAALQQAWAGLLGSLLVGYTGAGTPEPLMVPASLSIRG